MSESNYLAYFVSDLHLGSDEEPKALLFKEFLKNIKQEGVTHLFLLGDIFDLWIADHNYFKERYAEVVEGLIDLAESGVEIHYFEGNHDLYLRHYWENQLGFYVYSEASYIELGNKTLRLEHGDQSDPEDKGYLFLRWFLRTPFMKAFSKYMPESVIVKIGESASHKSRTYTSEVKTIDNETSIQKIRAHAEKSYHERPFDLMVSGHVHVKDDYSFNEGKARAINLGTWLEEACALRVTPKDTQLKLDFKDES